MKNIIKIASLLAIALTISCAKEEKLTAKNAGAELSNLPDWVVDPSVKEGVAAVGIAGPSRGGIKFQIPTAELDAKANIASTIQSEISRVTKNSLRSAKVNENDDVEEFFSQATKEVVKDLPLSGVKRLHMFKAEDGTLYIHMLLTNEDYSKFLENSQKTFEARAAKSNAARASIDKTQAATKEIFDELERERAAK